MVRMSLSEMKVRQLRRLATELRIRGRWRMRKQQLADAISARQEEEALRAAALAEPVGASLAPHVGDTSAAQPGVQPPAVPVEPSEDEVFIDRGRALPATYGAARLRVMTRDPDTLFVYWELPDEPPEGGWEVAALDADSVLMATARLGAEETRCYLNLPADEVQRVLLRPFGAAPQQQPPAPVAGGYAVILSREEAQPEPQEIRSVESGGRPVREDGSGQATSREHLPTTREETGERWVVVGMDGVVSASAPVSAWCGCGEGVSEAGVTRHENPRGPAGRGHSSHSVSRRQRR